MCRLAAIALIGSVAFAQTVDGVLLDNVTRAPLPGVIVTLLGPSRYNGTTDELGAFHIGSVQPGKYVLDIVKAGFLVPPAKRGAMQIDSDLHLIVAMEPLARFGGRLFYADGRPAAGAQLLLTRQVVAQGHSAATDASGHFEFEDLVPGSYILRGTAASPVMRAPEGEVWAPTWFPNALDSAAAEPITVVGGTVVTRDYRLRSVPLRHIRGIVRDETGEPSAGVTVSAFANQQKVQTDTDGSFDLVAYDGTWQISASKNGPVERRGHVSVFVDHHDVENVEMRLRVPFSVQILSESEGSSDPKPALSMPVVMLGSDDAPISGALMTIGNRKIEKVYPGRYYVRAILGGQGGQGLYVDSVKYGDLDVSDCPVDIWDGETPIRVSLSRGAPTVRGLVESGARAQVVFIPHEEPIRANRIQSMIADNRGNFEQSSLRPGDYYVLAFDGRAPLPVSDSSILNSSSTPCRRKLFIPGWLQF
ncbi:MAG: hypothetical protein P4L56_16250 [Candidatus Sulfopaludibacter sp.]|nr:hypothetical protein [Candidatus Sulfopaludibacter sp.]